MTHRSTIAYQNFPVIEETETRGWRFGAITALDDAEGCDYGDGFVVAPDGSRAGLVWETGDFPVREILPPDDMRWGVYSVPFPRTVRTKGDLTECFRAILPELQSIHARVTRTTGCG